MGPETQSGALKINNIVPYDFIDPIRSDFFANDLAVEPGFQSVFVCSCKNEFCGAQKNLSLSPFFVFTQEIFKLWI